MTLGERLRRRPPPDDDAPDALWRELERSRRYGREFAVLAVPVHGPGGQNGNGNGSEPAREALRRLVRSVDRVWYEEGMLYVLLPEASRATGERLIERIRERAPQIHWQEARLAAFPADALTGASLLELLRSRRSEGTDEQGLGLPIAQLLRPSAATPALETGRSGSVESALTDGATG